MSEHKHECPYCGATEGLRIASRDPWGGNVELICEGCFTGQDDGPCFDDLPAAVRCERGNGEGEVSGKLTKAQIEILRQYEHTRDGQFMQGVSGAAELWSKHGLLDWHGYQYGVNFYSITPAGRTALKEKNNG